MQWTSTLDYLAVRILLPIPFSICPLGPDRGHPASHYHHSITPDSRTMLRWHEKNHGCSSLFGINFGCRLCSNVGHSCTPLRTGEVKVCCTPTLCTGVVKVTWVVPLFVTHGLKCYDQGRYNSHK